MEGYTLGQLLRRDTVLGVLNRVNAPGNLMSQYYGLTIGAEPVATIIGNQGRGQYDIFDSRRDIGGFSTPNSPPKAMRRNPIGAVPYATPRQYNSIDLNYNELYGTRDLGMNPNGRITGRGLKYWEMQMLAARQPMQTLVEWMAIQTFYGGFSMRPHPNDPTALVPIAKGASGATITNDTKVPASHIGNPFSVFTNKWDNPATDIPGQFRELNVVAARENGLPITECWINGTTAIHLFKNESMRNQNGIANRVFNTLNPTQEIGPGQKLPDTGYSLTFGALPEITFHVYNQGYVNYGTPLTLDSQTDAANWNLFVPAKQAIMTPAPSTSWIGMLNASELAQWSMDQPLVEVMGYGTGFERSHEPPRIMNKWLFNGGPILLQPKAVYVVDVLP